MVVDIWWYIWIRIDGRYMVVIYIYGSGDDGSVVVVYGSDDEDGVGVVYGNDDEDGVAVA